MPAAFQFCVILITVVLFISRPNIITIMSVTFSLSLPNVELIRVHMIYCLNMQIRHMQMTYLGKKINSSKNNMYTRFV